MEISKDNLGPWTSEEYLRVICLVLFSTIGLGMKSRSYGIECFSIFIFLKIQC